MTMSQRLYQGKAFILYALALIFWKANVYLYLYKDSLDKVTHLFDYKNNAEN